MEGISWRRRGRPSVDCLIAVVFVFCPFGNSDCSLTECRMAAPKRLDTAEITFSRVSLLLLFNIIVDMMPSR
jgi:hypothetical protein